MAKDYGNNQTTKRGSKAPHQLLVVVATFLFGYITASIFDPETVGRWLSEQVLSKHEQKSQAIAQQQIKSHKAELPKPKFEFYTLLANENARGAAQNASGGQQRPTAKNNATASASQIASAAASTTSARLAQTNRANLATEKAQQMAGTSGANANVLANKTNTKNNYVVQVAAFKARQDAEHMKGVLILKGFEVSISPVATPSRGVWYRVIIGPYPNRNLAQKAQLILVKTERLRGIVKTA